MTDTRNRKGQERRLWFRKIKRGILFDLRDGRSIEWLTTRFPVSRLVLLDVANKWKRTPR